MEGHVVCRGHSHGRGRISNVAHLDPVVEQRSEQIVSVTVTVDESTGATAEDHARMVVERELRGEARVRSVRRILT